MKLLFCPEPMGWLPGLNKDEMQVVAPWALQRRYPVRFLRRRYAPGCRGWPGWNLVEGVSRVWARSDTGRSLRYRFWLRENLASVMSSWGTVDEVTAPSLAAQELFAKAGGKRTLVLDLPLFRELHADLDQATARHPSCGFLRNFRASAHVVARQEAELSLADEVIVFGHHVGGLLRARGIKCVEFPHGTQPDVVARDGELLLAGLATARNGAREALELLRSDPDLRLRVGVGDGAEESLLQHPRVSASHSLKDVRAVLAPAWVESYPVEVRRAAELGIPVVATRRAAGFVKAKWVEPGDVESLALAVQGI